MFLTADLVIQDFLLWNPDLIPEFEKITIVIRGELVSIVSIFRVLFYICIYLLIASWFVGLIIELVKIVAAIIIAVVIFLPIGLFKIDVIYSTYTVSISLLLNIFFWLYITIRAINIGLDLYRYKSDLSLNKEYTKKEAEGFKILEPSKKPVTKSVIKRIFKEPYEYSWLDSEFEIPKLDSSDQFVFTEWIPQRTKYVTSIREKSHNVLIMYFYVLIYSIIVFIFEDGMTTPIDATVRAFSLPIMIYFILGFRSLPKLVKSATVMLFYIYLVMMLFQAGIITANGIFYIYYLYLLLYGIHIIQLFFINPPEFINGIINGFVSPYDPNDLTFIAEVTDSVMANYYTVAGIACIFVYLAIWGLKTRKKESAMSLSNKNLFIRDKTKTSRINDVKIALKLVLNPVSPSNYRNALKKMQYNRLASIDSSLYDYGKIPLETLVKVKEKRAVPFYQIIFSVIWIVFFSWLVVTMIINRDQWYDIGANIVFVLVVLVPLITERKNMHLNDLRLKFDRSKVRGPWIYGHTYTTIEFKDVPKEFTEDFLLRCDPSIIHRIWTFRNLMNNLRKNLNKKIEEPI